MPKRKGIKMSIENFGQQLRRIRKEYRLTQLRMAKLLGMSLRAYNDCERQCKDPSIMLVLATEHLFGNENAMKNKIMERIRRTN